MGDGDVWGDVIRGFDGVCTASVFDDWTGWGVLLVKVWGPVELIWPNWILLPPVGFPAIGPPFDKYTEAPAALMVTEGLRLCSPRLGL